jgi:hypothetical protein
MGALMAVGDEIPCFWLTYADPLLHRVYDDDGNVLADEVDFDEWKEGREWRSASPIMVARDGRRGTLKDFGPGAMYDATTHPKQGDIYGDMIGPDGRCLMVFLPGKGHSWYVDGTAKSGGKWERTGDPTSDPPTVTVTPSILTPDYHGFLTSGVLREA